MTTATNKIRRLLLTAAVDSKMPVVHGVCILYESLWRKQMRVVSSASTECQMGTPVPPPKAHGVMGAVNTAVVV